jgi:hypothetical protein
VGHGCAKLPAAGPQFGGDPLDQRRLAAEQMDYLRDVQQHALRKNIRIDAHQGRKLLASRRHALQGIGRLRRAFKSQAEDTFHG